MGFFSWLFSARPYFFFSRHFAPKVTQFFPTGFIYLLSYISDFFVLLPFSLFVFLIIYAFFPYLMYPPSSLLPRLCAAPAYDPYAATYAAPQGVVLFVTCEKCYKRHREAGLVICLPFWRVYCEKSDCPGLDVCVLNPHPQQKTL